MPAEPPCCRVLSPCWWSWLLAPGVLQPHPLPTAVEQLLGVLEPAQGGLQQGDDTLLVPAGRGSYSQIQMSSQMLASEKKKKPKLAGALGMMGNLKQDWIIICIIISLDGTWKEMTFQLSSE